jgi:hypothetical protein
VTGGSSTWRGDGLRFINPPLRPAGHDREVRLIQAVEAGAHVATVRSSGFAFIEVTAKLVEREVDTTLRIPVAFSPPFGEPGEGVEIEQS